MPAGRSRLNWRRLLWALPVTVAGVIAPVVWGQTPPRKEKMPEVWVGARRVGAAPAPVSPPLSAPAPRVEPRSEAPPPPELKRLPFRRLDPPESIPVRTENPGTQVARSPVVPVSHHTTLMPAASMLPEYPTAPPAPAVQPTPPAYHPMVPPEPPVFDAPSIKESPPPVTEEPKPTAPRTEAPRIETVRVEKTAVESTPLYVTAVAQMVGVLAALSIFCGLGLAAHLFLVRKYGTSLLAPFRVEVVTTGPPAPPIPEWTMPPLKQLTVLERADEDEPPVEPNFEMPLTYEEEMALRKEHEAQQEMGVLQFIADMNRELQEQLKLIQKA